MRFSHVGMVARDVERPAIFYRTVFGCAPSWPSQKMTGEMVYKGTGLPPDAELVGTRRGEITAIERPGRTFRYVFVRDTEGNVIELKQSESA